LCDRRRKVRPREGYEKKGPREPYNLRVKTLFERRT